MAKCPKCGRKLHLYDVSQFCPGCGVNLNFEPCRCKKEVDPRLAKLAQLLENK